MIDVEGGRVPRAKEGDRDLIDAEGRWETQDKDTEGLNRE